MRLAAVAALPGGDQINLHLSDYGHFPGALLRGLPTQAPESAAGRYAAVVSALRALLDQYAGQIRAMSNMSYSFLSSALYLALLATCRDAIEAVRRLRAASAHPELCRLLWNLSRENVTRRLNNQDIEALAQTAGRALAALPPEEIPEFWECLTHHSLPRRLTVAPVLDHFRDDGAVPYLLHALTQRPEGVMEGLIACLGRIGDPRALPALNALAASRTRPQSQQARSAIAAIERAAARSPAQTLVRSVSEPTEPRDLLRPARTRGAPDPPEQLLRVRPPQRPEGEERP